MDKYNQYHENGYLVIDDFLPQNIAEELNTNYRSTNKWKWVNATDYKKVISSEPILMIL